MKFIKPEPGKACTIDVAGQQLELRFTLRVLKELDEKEHIPVLRGEGLGDALRNPVMLGTVLYYGITTKHPEITRDWIDDNVDSSMLLENLAPALAYAITGRAPDMDKILANLPNAERPTDTPTGSPSGPLADTTSGYRN